jgi:uncharacterized lipoprotein
MNKLVLACCVVLALSACTAQNWYEGVRLGQQSQCNQLPASQASECHQRVQPDYDQYQKQKQAIGQPAQ